MNKEIIIDYFKDKLTSPSTLTKAIKIVPKEILDELNKILLIEPEWEKLSYLVIGLVNNIQLKKCLYCGKTLTYSKSKYQDYCCNQHAQLDSRTRQKVEQTCLKKFGVKVPTLSDKVLEKRKENNLKKYGVENPISLNEVQNKRKSTCQVKYGGNSPICSENIQNKMKQTMLQRYGVEHNMQDNDIKQRAKLSNRLTIYKTFSKFSEYVTPLFSVDEYLNESSKLKWKCVKCGNEFIQNRIYTTGHLYKIDKSLAECPRCLNCYPILVGQSHGEKELVDFLKPYFNDLIENDRKLISPSELDIIIPSKKIAIEFNGSYWHSEQAGKDKNYHLNKTLKCEEAGYKLIHIFEHDWKINKELIKAKLKAILGIEQERIFARKCVIKEISTQLKNKFLNKNHIQGEDKAIIKLGLFNKDELVAVMTFCSSRFNKNYEWELSRYATSKHVIGGAGKLLKYFERKYLPKSLITYADRSYSQGNLYNQLGFEFLHLSEPNYCWSNGIEIFSRYQCQKSKLRKLFKNFDESKSESENMVVNGFYRIFDCGNLVFVKIF